MSNNNKEKGVFIVLEGSDGSGKGTQFELIVKRLRDEGYGVKTFDFPRYSELSSYFVHRYLNGDYGTVDQVGPYAASLFYALDRYQAAPDIRNALNAGKIVLANRFTASNMAHQGSKFENAQERKGYLLWLDNLEFEVLGIPRPYTSFVLRVPANIAQSLIDKKEERDYTTKKRDIHEADLKHLQKTVKVYDELCELFPKDFKLIDCIRNDKLMSILDIHNLVYENIKPLLPSRESSSSKSLPAKQQTKNPYIEKADYGYRITTAGRGFLKASVTNVNDDVYAFTDKLSPVTIAAAMARLSRRGDDMRTTILDEFADALGKDEQLLHRVITAYGDDSVQQLAGQHIVVENASNLLTKKLEWGRLASYLEQSTRYIYYDQKDKHGNYKYYTPEYLRKNIKNEYKNCMNKIFSLYSEMVHELTDYVRKNSKVPKNEQDVAWRGATRAQACDATRPVLPVATKSTVGIFASGQALESLIMHLLSDPLPEAHAKGRSMLLEARKAMSTFLERVDITERGVAIQGYRAFTYQEVKQIVQDYMPKEYTSKDVIDFVSLTDYWPRNELDLVADIIYEHSNSSINEIRSQVSSWSYDKKEKVLKAYMGDRLNRRHRPGRALEKAHYSWDLLCDYGAFRDLQRHRIVDDLAWQELTPRYGYETPELIIKAGLEEKFETCFEASLKLYSILQESGYELESQYAVLLGHKMRWKFTFNAREAFHLIELRTSPQGHHGYRKVGQAMYEKICEVHPIIASGMRFVNQGEDPELARLAAERYTQFKLSKLDKRTGKKD